MPRAKKKPADAPAPPPGGKTPLGSTTRSGDLEAYEKEKAERELIRRQKSAERQRNRPRDPVTGKVAISPERLVDLFEDDRPEIPKRLKNLLWAEANISQKCRGTPIQNMLRDRARKDPVGFQKQVEKIEREWLAKYKTAAPIVDEGSDRCVEVARALLKKLREEQKSK